MKEAVEDATKGALDEGKGVCSTLEEVKATRDAVDEGSGVCSTLEEVKTMRDAVDEGSAVCSTLEEVNTTRDAVDDGATTDDDEATGCSQTSGSSRASKTPRDPSMSRMLRRNSSVTMRLPAGAMASRRARSTLPMSLAGPRPTKTMVTPRASRAAIWSKSAWSPSAASPSVKNRRPRLALGRPWA